MTSNSKNLLGKYRIFQDGYFGASHYLINKFQQKPVEFQFREYFDEGMLIQLTPFLEKLRQEGIEVNELYRRYTVFNKKEDKYYIDWFLFLNGEKILINIEQNTVQDLSDIRFSMDTFIATQDVDFEVFTKILDVAKTCLLRQENNKRYINIVGKNIYGELMLKPHELKDVKINDLDLYYGQDFGKKNQRFVDLINEKDKSGIFIFHGVTGSGKTNYIRHLINQTAPNLNFIFYPVSLLRDISSPDLVTFLADYKNSILIIEESEESVQSREKSDTDRSMIANLLNVSDGLLSDALCLKVICTFNTDIRNLDKALLREGRLLGIHKFEKINPERANQIAAMHHIEKTFDKEVSLAQIFNDSLNDDLSDFIYPTAKKIGF